MFENLSTRTIILLGATGLGLALTVGSAIKDHRDNACCCEDACECECELADPTEETAI